MPQIDPSNPEALREALSGAALFQPEDTPAAEGGAGPAGDPARPGRGLGGHRGRRCGRGTGCRRPARWPRPSGGAGPPAGPAEQTFATLVGLELRPRRLREAAAIWRRLTDGRAGTEGRDAVWAHPDLLPTADDFDDPDGFVAGRHELDMSELEAGAADTPGADGTPGTDGTAGTPGGEGTPGTPGTESTPGEEGTPGNGTK